MLSISMFLYEEDTPQQRIPQNQGSIAHRTSNTVKQGARDDSAQNYRKAVGRTIAKRQIQDRLNKPVL